MDMKRGSNSKNLQWKKSIEDLFKNYENNTFEQYYYAVSTVSKKVPLLAEDVAEDVLILLPIYGFMNIVALASITTLLALIRDHPQLQKAHIDIVYLGAPQSLVNRFREKRYLPLEYLDPEHLTLFEIITTSWVYHSTSTFINLLLLSGLQSGTRYDLIDTIVERVNFFETLKELRGHLEKKIENKNISFLYTTAKGGVQEETKKASNKRSQGHMIPSQIFDDSVINIKGASTAGSFIYLIREARATKNFGYECVVLITPFFHYKFIFENAQTLDLTASTKSGLQDPILVSYLLPPELVQNSPYYLSEEREPWDHEALNNFQNYLKSLVKCLDIPQYFPKDVDPASVAIEMGFEKLFSRIHSELRFIY